MISESEGKEIGRTFIFTAIGIALIAFIAVFWMAVVRPQLINAEREGNVRSHGYVEARRTEVLNNIEECGRINVNLAQARATHQDGVVNALESQKQAIGARVRRALSEIPADGRSLDPSPCN